MKRFHAIALAVLTGLSGAGCAIAPSAALQDPESTVADSSCRNITSLDREGRVQSYCGTPAQWAEFDSRMAQLGQGFSCRPVKNSQPLCLFAKQWEHRDRTGPVYDNGFGDAAVRSAMEINHNDYATIRQDLVDAANGRPLPFP